MTSITNLIRAHACIIVLSFYRIVYASKSLSHSVCLFFYKINQSLITYMLKYIATTEVN
jgi:hypothetical protein